MPLVRDLVEAQHLSLKTAEARAQARALRLTMSKLREVRRELRSLEVGSWGWAERTAVMRTLQNAVTELSSGQVDLLKEGLAETAAVSAKDAAKYLRTMDKAYLGVVRPLRFEAISWVDNTATNLSKVRLREFSRSFARYGASTVTAIEDEVAKIVMAGEPWNTARKKVWEITKDVVGDKQWMVDRVLRTETSAVYNGMQLEALVEEDEPGDRMLKRLSATFDMRTGKDSVLLHGQTKKVKEPFVDPTTGREYQAPPNRPNDREVVVGWRESYGEFLDEGDEDYVTATATPAESGAPVPKGLKPKKPDSLLDIQDQMLRAEMKDVRRQIRAMRSRTVDLQAPDALDQLVRRFSALKTEHAQLVELRDVLRAQQAARVAPALRAEASRAAAVARDQAATRAVRAEASERAARARAGATTADRAASQARLRAMRRAAAKEAPQEAREAVTREMAAREVEAKSLLKIDRPKGMDAEAIEKAARREFRDGSTPMVKPSELKPGDVVAVDGMPHVVALPPQDGKVALRSLAGGRREVQLTALDGKKGLVKRLEEPPVKSKVIRFRDPAKEAEVARKAKEKIRLSTEARKAAQDAEASVALARTKTVRDLEVYDGAKQAVDDALAKLHAIPGKPGPNTKKRIKKLEELKVEVDLEHRKATQLGAARSAAAEAQAAFEAAATKELKDAAVAATMRHAKVLDSLGFVDDAAKARLRAEALRKIDIPKAPPPGPPPPPPPAGGRWLPRERYTARMAETDTGVGYGTIRHAVKTGKIPADPDGTFDAEDLQKWLETFAAKKAKRGLPVPEKLARLLESKNSGGPPKPRVGARFMDRDVYTVRQASDESGVGYGTIHHWVKTGKLKHRREGKNIVVDAADLEVALREFAAGKAKKGKPIPDKLQAKIDRTEGAPPAPPGPPAPPPPTPPKTPKAKKAAKKKAAKKKAAKKKKPVDPDKLPKGVKAPKPPPKGPKWVNWTLDSPVLDEGAWLQYRGIGKVAVQVHKKEPISMLDYRGQQVPGYRITYRDPKKPTRLRTMDIQASHRASFHPGELPTDFTPVPESVWRARLREAWIDQPAVGDKGLVRLGSSQRRDLGDIGVGDAVLIAKNQVGVVKRVETVGESWSRKRVITYDVGGMEVKVSHSFVEHQAHQNTRVVWPKGEPRPDGLLATDAAEVLKRADAAEAMKRRIHRKDLTAEEEGLLGMFDGQSSIRAKLKRMRLQLIEERAMDPDFDQRILGLDQPVLGRKNPNKPSAAQLDRLARGVLGRSGRQDPDFVASIRPEDRLEILAELEWMCANLRWAPRHLSTLETPKKFKGRRGPKNNWNAWCGPEGGYGSKKMRIGYSPQKIRGSYRSQHQQYRDAARRGDTPWTCSGYLEELDDVDGKRVKIAATTRHEFGHAVDFHLRALSREGNAEAKAILDLWHAGVEEVTAQTRWITGRYGAKKLDPTTGWGMVTEYAATEPAVEGLAETFALALFGRWDRIPEPLHAALRLMLEKRPG